MSIRFLHNDSIPVVPPILTDTPEHLRNFLTQGKEEGIERVYCGLTYGWRGWTDGGLWMLQHLPNQKTVRLVFTDMIITRKQMLDYYRRYKFISSMPSLYYRNIRLRLQHQKKSREMLILSDPHKSILILQTHLRILFTSINEPITIWIHPYMNGYTVTTKDQVIAFGLGVPTNSIYRGHAALKTALRKGVLQVRRWWEVRIQKTYMERGNPDAMFGWRYYPR